MHFTDNLKSRIDSLSKGDGISGPVYAGKLVEAFHTIYHVLRGFEDRSLFIRTVALMEEGFKLGEELGVKAACGQGCNHCCTQRVAVTPFEMEVLLVAPSTSDVDLQGRLKEQAEAEDFDNLPVETRKCVFLTESGCSIYPFRPFKCRLTHSRSVEYCISNQKSDPIIFDYAEIAYASYLSVLLERGLLSPSSDNTLQKQLYKLLSERRA